MNKNADRTKLNELVESFNQLLKNDPYGEEHYLGEYNEWLNAVHYAKQAVLDEKKHLGIESERFHEPYF